MQATSGSTTTWGFQGLTIRSPVRQTYHARAAHNAAADVVVACAATVRAMPATAVRFSASAPACMPAVWRPLNQYHGASR